jgi:aspartyl-tRNA(Asn)/glutamyl-tRNA(Gln) amidotransferase subunit B
MRSSTEAKAYAKELYLRMKYADVSYANLYYGNMRFDVNVSVSKTGQLGTRTETKNLNSFRSIEKAVEYEVARQIEVLEKGGSIVQETRGWDDGGQKTFSQRTKEDAHDYRYMPDPDLPPIVLEQSYIDEVKAHMPPMPDDYRRILVGIGIDVKTASDIIAVPETAMTVTRVYEASSAELAKRVAFWMLQPQSDDEIADLAANVQVPDKYLVVLAQMVQDNKLSSTGAKEVFAYMMRTGGEPSALAEEMNLLQVSDEGEIAKIVEQVLAENEKAASDVRGGEMKAIGFLVGQVMKLSKGKANPSLATELIKKQLGL